MHGSAAFQIIGIIFAVLLGVGGLIRGYQLRKGRLDLVSDWDNRPLPNPEEHAPVFSRVYLRLGGIVLLSPAALVLGTPLVIWAAILAVLVWYWFEAIDRIASRAHAALAAHPAR